MAEGELNRITTGIAPNEYVEKTLQFVRDQLPRWRDDASRPRVDAEEELNGQLCKQLNVAARRENFSMAYFQHEERQSGRRRVDLSALPPVSADIQGRSYSNYDPFLVIECKRLPAPGSDRDREYVTGGDKTSGGIQRFKLGVHGGRLRDAAMIGYVQGGTFRKWFRSINGWIGELAASSCDWSADDCLGNLSTDEKSRVARCTSVHARVNSETSEVRLTHLWVDMKKR
ncbi:hypothetical protein Pan216_03520 [Planctomycetes bacterium Pan216]|uniref:Uncharacterized protein n=1 Tax=Kolteria novifilia TaxID=2527975 RepID=A0A518AXS5_9BACT|nr:hypothetical protein Pan216_03520 [Planctomycetes bacterium Pan216]